VNLGESDRLGKLSECQRLSLGNSKNSAGDQIQGISNSRRDTFLSCGLEPLGEEEPWTISAWSMIDRANTGTVSRSASVWRRVESAP